MPIPLDLVVLVVLVVLLVLDAAALLSGVESRDGAQDDRHHLPRPTNLYR